jgi:Do/DeqQ family serine protease
MSRKNWGGALAFVAVSIATGLAVAFLLVAFLPDLIRPRAQPAPAPALPAATVAGPARASYSDAVQAAAPAVVNIYTARLVTERVAPSSLEEMFGDFWPRYQQRIERSLGSGVIVDAQGHIVTNHHVIANAEAINVQLADGRTADARIVGRDPDSDLAVLIVDLKPVPVATFGRSDRLKVGDVVLAIGNPIGLSQTVTHGIVSATGRQQLGLASFEDFIQTDAAINVGNSGGALVDTQGALIGINTAIVAKSLGVEGIGFAIPVNMVRGVLDDIVARGRVVRGWIGIVPQDVNEQQARQFGLPRHGVLLANLFVNSPALKAGLQPGDMILEIDGTPVQSARDAIARVAAIRPGAHVTLVVWRNAQRITARAQVIERPRNK